MSRKSSTTEKPSQKPPLIRTQNSSSRIFSRKFSSTGKSYNTFTSKKRKMDSHMGQKRGSMSALLSVPALLSLSFWLFGTLVTMQFGVVLTAANDLVGDSAPPGLILFAYTLPSVLVRTFVPYIKFPNVSSLLSSRTPNRGSGPSQEINYAFRLSVCAFSSFIGLQLLAWADNVGIRMIGIALASLSSNLGDMSFYQLATRYPSMIARSFGGYAAGSGAAGLVGSSIYTLLTTSFSVTPAAVLSGVGLAPTVMLLTYFCVLPSPEATGGGEVPKQKTKVIGRLKLGDKIRMVRPMVMGYMAPLAVLMFLENITTQGTLPTILYHLPFPSSTPHAKTLNAIFTSTRSFYPFFFTTYQFSIFLGRTSITLFRLPGVSPIYWTLCILEITIALSMMSQSLSMRTDTNILFSPFAVMALVFAMGLCGGLGMSNTYWRVSKKPLPGAVWVALDKARLRRKELMQEDGLLTPGESEQEGGYFSVRPRLRKSGSSRGRVVLAREGSVVGWRTREEETAVREFLIGTIALPDTFAIMVAGVVSMWLQPALCRWQIEGGRDLCRNGVA